MQWSGHFVMDAKMIVMSKTVTLPRIRVTMELPSNLSCDEIEARIASQMKYLTINRTFFGNSESRKKQEKKTIEHNVDLTKFKIKTVLDLHPGITKYEKLAESMEPVVIDGLEHVKGVLRKVIVEKFWYEEKIDLHIDDTFETGMPAEEAMVWVHLASFVQGNVQPLEFNQVGHKISVINLNNALPGIVVACRSLKPGQCAQFLLPPSTMFGELGYNVKDDKSVNVPPSATILLLLHMVKWVDVNAVNRYESLPDDAKKDFEKAQTLINKVDAVGASYYRRRRYEKSIGFYEKLRVMLSACEVTVHNQVELNRLKFKTHLNMAIALMKMKNYEAAKYHLNESSVLCDCRVNCKYMFWRGKCYFMLEEYEKAFEFLLEASYLEPNNPEIGIMLCKVDEILATNREVERNIATKAINAQLEEESESRLEHERQVTELIEVRTVMEQNNLSELPVPNCRMIMNDLAVVKNIDDFEIESRPSMFESNSMQFYFIIPSKR